MKDEILNHHRYFLEDIISDQQSLFDKSILNLSTVGIIGISALKMNIQPPIENSWIGTVALICYFCSMWIMILSFLASIKCVLTDCNSLCDIEGFSLEEEKRKFSYKCAYIFLITSSWIAASLFTIAVIATIIFITCASSE